MHNDHNAIVCIKISSLAWKKCFKKWFCQLLIHFLMIRKRYANNTMDHQFQQSRYHRLSLQLMSTASGPATIKGWLVDFQTSQHHIWVNNFLQPKWPLFLVLEGLTFIRIGPVSSGPLGLNSKTRSKTMLGRLFSSTVTHGFCLRSLSISHMSHVAAMYQPANQPMAHPTKSGGKFAPVGSQIGPICLEKQGKSRWQRSKRDKNHDSYWTWINEYT